MIAGNIRLSRRHFLLMALASLTTGCSSTDNAGPNWLPQVIGDLEAAARLGHAYLGMHPEYYNSNMLVTDIQQALARYDASAAAMKNLQQTVAAFQQLVRHEYAQDETETVTGWVLSVTEARLYALPAIKGN
jgi:hypothetical protein